MSGQKLKVMHILSVLGFGGTEYGVVKLLNNLDPDRFDCSIVSLSQIKPDIETLVEPHVKLYCVPKEGKYNYRGIMNLVMLARRNNVDIVHTHNWATYFYGFCMAVCIRGLALVHGEHGRDQCEWILPRKRYYLLKLFTMRTKQLIAVTKDIRDSMVLKWKIPEPSVRIIENGVDLDRFKLSKSVIEKKKHDIGISGDSIVIGNIGVLRDVKNHGLLFNAFKGIRGEFPNCILLIIGDDPHGNRKEMYIKQVEELGIAENVVFLGQRTDIPELLGCMDIYVNMSLFEGMSNTILEAMASRLPVVASNVGGNPELVSHEVSGLLFPSGDLQGLIDALKKLLLHKELRIRMAERGHETIMSKHSLDKMIKENMEVYERVLHR